jgi:hypothetical protein
VDNGLKRLEEKILDEYLSLVQKIQPELDRHFFYDVMPEWEDYRAYRLEESGHKKERDKIM